MPEDQPSLGSGPVYAFLPARQNYSAGEREIDLGRKVFVALGSVFGGSFSAFPPHARCVDAGVYVSNKYVVGSRHS